MKNASLLKEKYISGKSENKENTYLGLKYNRLQNIFSFRRTRNKQTRILSILGHKYVFQNKLTTRDKDEYINWVCNHQLDKSNFVKLSENNYTPQKDDVKTIAFYLPQFHDFKENVKWFGRGFSEWSNTSKAVPQFAGHWQPHIPIDVGYYNLDHIDIMKRQIELAKKYGLYGFSFYYYWFSGDKLMEKPLEKFLNDQSLDMPFFLFWANEDWTMLWDNGEDREVLHKFEFKEEDADKFMNDALPYFKDKRYIKIDNKPLLVIYEIKKYAGEKYLAFNKRIREIAKANGFDDLYILTTTASISSRESQEKFMLDGILEFFPKGLTSGQMDLKKEKFINKLWYGKSFNVKKYIEEKKYIYNSKNNVFKGCFPSWDNTSRKCYKDAFVFQNTPTDYKKWLIDIIKWTKNNKKESEQIVFINAWNEWAEGAHLEPDQKYGYAFLQATKEAIEESKNKE